MKVFLIFIVISGIIICLPASHCLAEEFSFTAETGISFPLAGRVPISPTFYLAESLIALRDCIVKDISINNLSELPPPVRSNIFETIDEISRSIAETSTCL